MVGRTVKLNWFLMSSAIAAARRYCVLSLGLIARSAF